MIVLFPTRKGSADHARMLIENGYGVLAVDMRGYDGSEGDPNAFGWGATRDLDAAIAFLESRPEVEDGAIGGLGLSVGGEELLETAAENEGLAAVVSEGAGIRSVRDAAVLGAAGLPVFPQYLVQTRGRRRAERRAAAALARRCCGGDRAARGVLHLRRARARWRGIDGGLLRGGRPARRSSGRPRATIRAVSTPTPSNTSGA